MDIQKVCHIFKQAVSQSSGIRMGKHYQGAGPCHFKKVWAVPCSGLLYPSSGQISV